jgi:hypothetical protein
VAELVRIADKLVSSQARSQGSSTKVE